MTKRWPKKLYFRFREQSETARDESQLEEIANKSITA
jgi:hypothetical protein